MTFGDAVSRRQWLSTSAALGACLWGEGLKTFSAAGRSRQSPIIELGSRRELFVDRYLIDNLQSVDLRLHRPQPREKVLTFEERWEGCYCGYATVIQGEGRYQLYYRGLPVARHSLDTEVTCVAESEDGIRWTKPPLGLYEVEGTRLNNVVLARSRGCHNLAPFIDVNPEVAPQHRYKALGGSGRPGLLAFVSADGLAWSQLQEDPVITEGAFDSQNNAFWSTEERQYVCHFRVFRDGMRWIARSTSPDFLHWSDPVDLGLDGRLREQLYTNQLAPYDRAPHFYLGLPTRFFPGRRVVTKAEAATIGTPAAWDYANDCTDIAFTSMRSWGDFRRTFMEAYLRPGTDLRNWTSRANYAARGLLQTAEDELSFYVLHHSGYPSIHLRRYSLRLDGFASLASGYDGGQCLTRPFVFEGAHLYLNYSTSAGGHLRLELQTAAGEPVPGFQLETCSPIIGDRIEHQVQWSGGADCSRLAGTPVRLRIALRDADLFSFHFDA